MPRFLLALVLIPGLSCPGVLAKDANSAPLAPPFELPGLDGKPRRLADFAGQVMVVNFWASWCIPCREELPSMNRAAAAMRDEPLVWLAINVGEDDEAVAAFLGDFPIEFPVLLDRRGRVSKDWRVSAMPTTWVIDRSGAMAYKAVGKRDWDDAAHRQLLGELIAGQ